MEAPREKQPLKKSQPTLELILKSSPARSKKKSPPPVKGVGWMQHSTPCSIS
nr:MAG TPA: hypothetical protein [Caudoviricetes sp.]